MYVSNREKIRTRAAGITESGAPIRYRRPGRQTQLRAALREQGALR